MPSQRGLSLLELLIVLSITAVLTSMAIGYMVPSLAQVKTQGMGKTLLHHLHYARSEAIKTNSPVGVCGLGDHHQCSDNWERGYIIFKGFFPHQETISITEYPPNPIHIAAHFNSDDNTLRFTPEGRTFNNGRITLSMRHSAFSQTLVVSLTGRARLLP